MPEEHHAGREEKDAIFQRLGKLTLRYQHGSCTVARRCSQKRKKYWNSIIDLILIERKPLQVHSIDPPEANRLSV